VVVRRTNLADPSGRVNLESWLKRELFFIPLSTELVLQDLSWCNLCYEIFQMKIKRTFFLASAKR
jgi:hypothetical protein